MSLREQAFSGIRWTTFSSLGRVGLQLVQVTILARLLTPADFGLVAVVMALIAVVQIFSDAGVSNAIIHFQDIAAEEYDSLYWLNVCVSAILSLLLIIASRWIGLLYAQPMLGPLLMIAAFTVFVGALGQQLRILAQKNLRFVDLARVELGGACVGSVIAVALAVLGARAYSLLIGNLGAVAATTSLAWLYLSDGWRPDRRMHWREIRRFVEFGAYTIGNNLANALNSQIDVLLGARLLGAQSIGLYSVPKDLSLRLAGTINPIVTEVSLPLMAGMQRDKPLLKRLYLQMMRMTASVTFPAYVALAVFAPEVVEVVLGREWQSAAPLLRILSCWALLRSIGNPVGTMLMALGRPALSFAWNAVLLVLMPPIIWFGSRYGLRGMALAMALVGLILYLPNWYFLVHRLCGAKLGEYTYQVALPLGVSLLAGLAGYAAVSSIEQTLPRLIAGVLVGAGVYLAFSWYLNRQWSLAMFELLDQRR